MAGLSRIIWHWSAGSHTPSDLDKQHYHFIIDGAGKVHNGRFAPEANIKPQKGKYAAHTLNCNTGSIGVAVAAMAGAVEAPFDAGRYPITPAQEAALAGLSRKLGAQYGIPVTPQTMLSHAEVQPTLGIKQRGKWDIAWLPGMAKPGNPVAVGNRLRAAVAAVPVVTTVSPKPVAATKAPDPVIKTGEPGERANGGGGGGFLAALIVVIGGAALAFRDTVQGWIDWLFN